MSMILQVQNSEKGICQTVIVEGTACKFWLPEQKLAVLLE